MSRSFLLLMTMLALAAFAAPAYGQLLTCSDAGAGDCHFFHFHVQSYNDRSKNFVELYGTNRFATIEACEAERTRKMDVEQQAVTYVLKLAPRARVKASNFGPCHCDMTSTPSSRFHLDDESRFRQMHLQRDIALQLLEEAYDKGMPTDSPVALGLSTGPTSWVASAWPTVADVPPDSPDRFLSTEPPQPRKTEISAVQTSQLDTSRYTLVEIAFDSEVPLETVTIDDDSSEADPAAGFVNEEIAAVQSHLSAVLGMEEGSRKERLLELIQQRVQLLSNLSRLVQTAGPSSALGSGIAAAHDQEMRRGIVGSIFGPTVEQHWSPEDPQEMLIELPDSIVTDPVAVLRDPGNRFSRQERQLALYVFLMRTGGLTENQEIWLSGIIESWLKEETS